MTEAATTRNRGCNVHSRGYHCIWQVLLATIHSGGVGLNIAAANHVIFSDRWFNPQTMEQAIARVHRIKQDG